jgi:hypothetical protein
MSQTPYKLPSAGPTCHSLFLPLSLRSLSFPNLHIPPVPPPSVSPIRPLVHSAGRGRPRFLWRKSHAQRPRPTSSPSAPSATRGSGVSEEGEGKPRPRCPLLSIGGTTRSSGGTPPSHEDLPFLHADNTWISTRGDSIRRRRQPLAAALLSFSRLTNAYLSIRWRAGNRGGGTGTADKHMFQTRAGGAAVVGTPRIEKAAPHLRPRLRSLYGRQEWRQREGTGRFRLLSSCPLRGF